MRMLSYIFTACGILCAGLYCPKAHAETQNAISMTVPSFTPGNSGSFSASQLSGSAASGSGTFTYTYSGQIQIGISSGTGRYASLPGATRMGVGYDSFLLFQSFISNNYLTVASSNSSCPAATNYTWLNLRYRTPDLARNTMNLEDPGIHVGGRISYDPAAGTLFTGVNYFDMAGPTLTAAPTYGYNGLLGATCSSGSFKLQATGADIPLMQYGTMYFGSHSFVYTDYTGNPIVVLGLPQQTLDGTIMSSLANDVLSGRYTYFTNSTTQSQKNIYVFPDSNGTTFTLKEVGSLSDPTVVTNLGTVVCTSLNSPTAGFCSGTLALNGVAGTGNAVCHLYAGSDEHILACAAQYPADKAYAVSFVANTPKHSLLAVTPSANVTALAAENTSTTVTMTVRNMSGRPVATMGNPSDLGQNVALNLSAPFSNTGAFAGSSHTGGACGTTLKGYGSCTVTVTYNPTSQGTSLQTYRVGYNNGLSVVNATTPVIGTAALSSITVTPATTTFRNGTSQQFTATAHYGNGSTQDVTSAVTWSSSNTGIFTVNSSGSAAFVGSGVGATITAALGAVSGNTTLTVRTLSSIAITPAKTNITGGNTQQMTATGTYDDASTEDLTASVTWALSSGVGTISINSSGLVTSILKEMESVTITASLGGISATTRLYTSPPASYANNIVGASKGDNGPLDSAVLYGPYDLAKDSNENVYFIDNTGNKVRMMPAVSGTYFGQVMTAGKIYTIAGTGAVGSTGDGAAATAATINSPRGIAVDSSRNVFLTEGSKLRMIAATSATFYGQSMTANYIYTIAGTGVAGFTGDGAVGTSAKVNNPHGVAVDSSGNVFFSDNANDRVRVVAAANGTIFGQAVTGSYIYTVMGTGTATSTGDGAIATSATINNPIDLDMDSSGNLFVSENTGNRVRMIAATTATFYGQAMTANYAYTVAGGGGGTVTGALATAAAVPGPYGIDVSSAGDIFISSGYAFQMVPAASGTYFGQSMTANYVYVVAGINPLPGTLGDGGIATSAKVNGGRDCLIDGSGNLLISDLNNHRIRVVAASNGTFYGQSMTTGYIYPAAGVVSSGYIANGVAATSTALANPTGVILDSSGNLYISDYLNFRVRMVPATSGTYFGQTMTANNIYTIAGNGNASNSGDGGLGTSAALHYPRGALGIDSVGNIYIGVVAGHKIRVLAKTSGTYFGQAMTAGYIYSVAGTGTSGFSGDGAAATSAKLQYPRGASFDSAGNMFISDASNCVIRMVPVANGTYFGQAMTANYIYTVAGIGGSCAYAGDGGAATSATLVSASSVRVDANDNLVIADNTAVRVVARTTATFYGIAMTANYIYSIAGNGVAGSTGDGGAATSAKVNVVVDIAIDSTGNIFTAENTSRKVRMISAVTATQFGQAMTANYMYTIAGTGTATFSGDDGIGTSAKANVPQGVAVDSVGNVYFAETVSGRIRMIAAVSGIYWGKFMTVGYVYTVAGVSAPGGSSGDSGAATSAFLSSAEKVAVDSSGNLYVADTGNHKIRMVPITTGTYFGQSMTANRIYTIAGTGSEGSSGDSGAATSATLNAPKGVALDSSGNVYIADTGNHKIRKITASTAVISTIAGTGSSGSSGDGGAATSATLSSPRGIAVDTSGNIFIADTGNHEIRMIAGSTATIYGQSMTSGRIYTVAGTGVAGYTGDNGAATSGTMKSPTGVSVDSTGNIYIADRVNNVVRMVAATTTTNFAQSMTANRIYTIAGTGTAGVTGDSGVGTSATLNGPNDVAVDSAGNVYIADYNNHRVRMLAANTTTYFTQSMTANSIYTIAGSTGGDGQIDGTYILGTTPTFGAISGLTMDYWGNLIFADSTNHTIFKVIK